jgi:hypothetical protein
MKQFILHNNSLINKVMKHFSACIAERKYELKI